MSARVLNVSCGPKNLAVLFDTIDFGNIAEYFLEIMSGGDVYASTPLISIQNTCKDTVRLHFLNYLGTIDAINFILQTKDHEPKSDTRENSAPRSYPYDFTKHGIQRINVRSNDTYTAVCNEYTEEEMPWLEELLDSPVAWLQVEGKQGLGADYLPVVIVDKKNQTRKEEDRYIYEITIEFKLSHERVILRN
jgi:hypothetical protein